MRFTDYSECYVRRVFLLIIVNAELAEDSCTTAYSERLLLCSPLSVLPRCGSVALRLAIKHDAASGLNSTDYSECLSCIQEAALTRIESLLTTVNVWGRCHDVHLSGDAILCFTVYSERCSKQLRDDLRYPCSLSNVQRMTFQENLRYTLSRLSHTRHAHCERMAPNFNCGLLITVNVSPNQPANPRPTLTRLSDSLPAS